MAELSILGELSL